MNAFHVSTMAVAVLCAFGSAHAAEGSSLTRAHVAAELAAEQSAGTFGAMSGEDSGSFHFSQQPYAATTTREEVSGGATSPEFATLKAAMLYLEERGYSWFAASLPPGYASADGPTRREVAAEAAGAVASGEAHARSGEDGGAFYYARAAIEALPAQRVAGAYGVAQ